MPLLSAWLNVWQQERVMAVLEKLEDVAVVLKANVYFDGKVVSHTLMFKDGSKKTVGLIYPGSYSFNTGAPERMEIIDGVCRARLKGSDDWKEYAKGSYFDVPGSSSFEISVEKGLLEYLCSFKAK